MEGVTCMACLVSPHQNKKWPTFLSKDRKVTHTLVTVPAIRTSFRLCEIDRDSCVEEKAVRYDMNGFRKGRP